ncbi:MAG: hypothetical protein CM1200mP30_25510 [Pseudomonadota bacterium]|nr:MAG: hypothetical protein CM1200mP30_25510 [Pseudomonadota bacterium]
MTGFIEPLEVAFPTVTFGIFMVLMVLLGGKGNLWGPVIGAIIFHVIKEITWTYLLGWQWVAWERSLSLMLFISSRASWVGHRKSGQNYLASLLMRLSHQLKKPALKKKKCPYE